MRNLILPDRGMSTLILKLVLVISFVCMAMMAQAQATVTTDQLDYAPGSTAIITGTGFQPGEEVELHVHHVGEDSLGTDPQNHQPWSVTADAEGKFTTFWHVPSVEEGDALGATLLLEAHGNFGSEAEWIFTDGTAQISSVSVVIISPLNNDFVNDNTSIVGENQGGGNLSNFGIKIHQTTPTGPIVRDLYSTATLNANSSTPGQIWNGKNNANVIVPDGIYYAVAGSGTPYLENTASNRVKQIIVDNTNPNVSLVSPLDNGIVLPNTSITFSATPLDAGGNDDNIAKVDFYIGVSLIGTDVSSGGGGWNYTLSSGKPAGTYTWTAKAYDKAGNNVESTSRTFVAFAKVPLTVTADNKSKVYDGLVYNLFTVSYSGFVDGNDASDLGGTLTFTGTATTAVDFGNNYKIVPSGLISNKYEIEFVQGTLDISKRPITITADAKSKVFGNSDPALTYQITSGSLVLSDAFSGSLTRAAGTNVGTYPILQGTVALSNNYTLGYIGANLTITKAAATLTWAPGTLSQIYDGTVKTVVATTNPPGLLVEYAFTGTPQNVGNYPVTATINDINYEGSLAGVLEIISPATNTSVESSLNPSVYGDEVIFTATITSLGGTPDNATVTFYDGSTIIGTTTSSAGVASLAISTLNAGYHDITATYSGAGIFLSSTSAILNQVVSKADATVTVNGYSGVYDAATHGATGSATGVEGEDLSTGLNFGSAFTDAPGGTTNWTFTGGTNYNDQSGSTAIVITKADATVIVNGYTGVYDANAHGATGTASGVGGVDLSTGLSLGSAFADVPGGTASWTFTGGTNYNDQSGDAAIVINKADAVVTVNGYTGTFDASAHGATGSAQGVAGDPTAAGSSLNLGASFTNVPGGTAHWTFTGGTNYNNQNGSVDITITPAPLSVAADNKSKYCGQVNPPLTGTVTGVLGTDGITASYSTTATAASPAGTYAIAPTLVDPNGKLGNYAVTSTNGTFTINSITIDASASSIPVPVGSTASLTATVSPAAEGIPVVFTLNNGNGGITTYNAITNASGVASTTASGLAVELYLVTATAGNSCASSIAYLPVYDPNGGFVTGGGWINSPAGAYTANPSLVGKANFGFVSKYKKGSTQVDGNTEFQFQTGNLNFKSTSNLAASLVIAGSQAIYKGAGTINGGGSYSFMVSAVDGDETGGGGTDKFRIKIWDGSGVVYDNQMGASDNATATTVIGGGSIVIHTAKNGRRDVTETTIAKSVFDTKASIYPNPVNDQITVRYLSESKANVSMVLFDLNGKTIVSQQNKASENGEYNIQVGHLGMSKGFYILKFSQEGYIDNLKVMKD
jgi:hypothetical protein